MIKLFDLFKRNTRIRPGAEVETVVAESRDSTSVIPEYTEGIQKDETGSPSRSGMTDGDGGQGDAKSAGKLSEGNSNVGTGTYKGTMSKTGSMSGLGRAAWKKVSAIKVGDRIAIVHPSAEVAKTDVSSNVIARSGATKQSTEIATPLARNDGDVGQGSSTSDNLGTGTLLFDEVVSIKKVGFERVWDIEVAKTHNFVGNGILAHNTYINGNVGIGTTAPSYVLDVQHDTSKINSKNGYLTNGADYAEYFETKDTDLSAGEAVCIDTLNANAVSRCSRPSDANIMGIVSTNPAFLGNASLEKENNPNYKAIAMLGQIPAKVTDENGEIRIGDSLTASSTSGHLMKANAGDSTVGVALEGFARPSAEVDTEVVEGGDNGTTAKSESNSALGRVGTGTIQVMISRRNKSLTVETVEAKVTERIASMKIEDEVNILVANAVASLTPSNTLTLDTNGNVVFTNDPTKTVDLLANNAEVQNITDSLITLQSDYETLKNTTEERIDKIESTILTSVFEKEYKAEKDILIGEIVSFDGEKAVKAGGENRDMILGVVIEMSSSLVEDQVDSGQSQNDGGGDNGNPNSGGTMSKTSSISALGRGTGTILVTTRGRVKVQVTKENGEVKKGDAITSSTTTEGKGTKAVTEGMIIGYALNDAEYQSTLSSSLVEDQVDSGLSQNDDGGDKDNSIRQLADGTGDDAKGNGNVGTGTGTVEIAISPIWYALSSSSDSSSSSLVEDQVDSGPSRGGQARQNDGDVSLLSLTVDNNTLLNGSLSVLGNSSFADIFASGKLSVGLLALSSEDNSINVIGETLKLQNNYGAGNIEAFGGKIVLTSTGDLKVLGTIEVDKLKANEVEVEEGITIRDKITDEFFCVTVKDGVLSTTKGSCRVKQ